MNDRYVVVEWSECQWFMNEPSKIHLAASSKAYDEFGDSAYFIELNHYKKVAGQNPYPNEKLYAPVIFPESQPFANLDNCYPIEDANGLVKFGNGAFFVEEQLYLEVSARPKLLLPEP